MENNSDVSRHANLVPDLKRYSVFHYYDVSCNFVDVFYQVEGILTIPIFLRDFSMNMC